LKQKIIIGSLIGKFIRISDSKNKSLTGLDGKIIDETKNTITLKTKNKEIKIIKNQIKI
jgi:RNase P/RNase MRP subunit p29